MSTDHRVHKEWLRRHVEHVDSHSAQPLNPALEEFKNLIESNTRIYMLFNAMWDEIPPSPYYHRDPTGERQIRDYKHMLAVLNRIFSRAPEWVDAAASVGTVGVPMNAVFDYAMSTPSGHAAFLDPDVNKCLKRVLNAWGEYLKTPASASVLSADNTGWLGEVGSKDAMEVANMAPQTDLTFDQMFECDPKAKHHGYASWDDFFTRKVKASARSVASPDNDAIIVEARESRPFCLAHDVSLRDKFWIKGQLYSILDMLAQSPLATEFAGGTVYQGFLSALSYHRVPLCEYETTDDENGVSVTIQSHNITNAQGYLTALATRGIIFIEADNPAVGLMVFIGVGMDEVSTCEITVREGQRVKKGEQLGMFHFGGSTHCLIWRMGVKLDGFPEIGRKENVAVRSQLCVVQE
ncbi:hypothetical protein OQA88_9887 [Cercophora sp. LCS_1]